MSSAPLKKILLFLGIFVLILAGLLYGGFRYVVSINENIVTLNHDVLVQTKKQNHLAGAEAAAIKADKNITRINNSIIANDGDVSFIEGIESMARADSVEIKIDSLSLGNTSELDKIGLTVLKVKLEIKGAWPSVYLFASGMESLPYNVKIDRFDLVNTGNTTSLDPKKDKSPGPWQALFEISVLKFK